MILVTETFVSAVPIIRLFSDPSNQLKNKRYGQGLLNMHRLVPDHKQISEQLKRLALLAGQKHCRAERQIGLSETAGSPGSPGLPGTRVAMSRRVLVLHPDTIGKEAALSYQQLLEYLSPWLEGKMARFQ